MAKILFAKPTVEKIVVRLKSECEALKNKNITPKLRVLLVGEHAPSVLYTRNKKKFIESFGGICEILNLPAAITEEEFLGKLNEASNDQSIHGLFVQLPLPKHLSHIDVGQLVPPAKDVDGFHAESLYHLLRGEDQGMVSCTPKGIITLLKENNIEMSGKNAVVIGRSMIVGKPMSMLLTNENATVTMCHSRTKDLKEITKRADIIICALGKARFLTKEYLSPSQDVTIIDVGINHDENGVLCGDADFEHIQEYCCAISPVPGGVGPLTIASLGENLIKAASGSLQ